MPRVERARCQHGSVVHRLAALYGHARFALGGREGSVLLQAEKGLPPQHDDPP